MTKTFDLYDRFLQLDRALVAAGWNPTSPFFKRTLKAFFRSDAKIAVWRIGRRGGKSSTLCRVAVALTLYGDHVIPPGDIGVFAFVSVNKLEATARLRTIAAILDVIGHKYTQTKELITHDSLPFAWQIKPASIGGTSGFTSVGFTLDEAAKLRDEESGANPAREVLAALRPTMATQPRARGFICSSPMGLDDLHAELMDLGDTANQMTATAETWLANPSVTEEYTHSLEADLRIWQREYAAIPQSSVSGCFDAAAVERAFKPHDFGIHEGGRPVCLIDPSSGRNDTYTYCIARYWSNESGRYEKRADGTIRKDMVGNPMPSLTWKPSDNAIEFYQMNGFQGAFFGEISGNDIAKRISAIAKAAGCTQIYSDSREELGNSYLFTAQGMQFISRAWSQSTKMAAAKRVKRWLSDGLIVLPPACKELRTQLLTYEERVSNGGWTYGPPPRGHDDYVSLLLLAAHPDVEKYIDANPLRRTGGIKLVDHKIGAHKGYLGGFGF